MMDHEPHAGLWAESDGRCNEIKNARPHSYALKTLKAAQVGIATKSTGRRDTCSIDWMSCTSSGQFHGEHGTEPKSCET